MRRTLVAVMVALALSASGLAPPSVTPSSAATGRAEDTRPAPGDQRAATASRTLERAADVLAGEGPATSATLALRDLFIALPTLRGSESAQARRLLDRPSASKRRCSTNICLHWKRTGADAPPGRGWVRTTMDVMKTTWQREIARLGYRRPVKDGGRGGNGKFDVYLRDLGPSVYGYCAPEDTKPGFEWVAWGFCVLDDDFARSQFGQNPMKSLKATAAHEFFHAVQFGYDYGEDKWLMEATATWMEERVFDRVNDNRQYLRAGQVKAPGTSLDFFKSTRSNQYGNWAFFEYLSQRLGTSIVRSIWNRAGAFKGAPDHFSTVAVRRALPRGRTFPEVFRHYASANTIPGRTYSEGDRWPSATIRNHHRPTSAKRRAGDTLAIQHMASQNVSIRPGNGLGGKGWKLRVTVNGPDRPADPAAYLLVHRKGGRIERKAVGLDRAGDGGAAVGFSSGAVTKVTITLANASTRFNCWEGQLTYSCQGIPRDHPRQFSYQVRVFRR